MAEFLSKMQEQAQNSGPKPPRPLHEAQIAELRILGEAYGCCPFKVGDLVTPRGNCNVTMAKGEPWLVVDVLPRRSEPLFDECGPGDSEWGTRPDFRVLVLYENNRSIGAFWNESWKFELYVPQPEEPKAGD